MTRNPFRSRQDAAKRYASIRACIVGAMAGIALSCLPAEAAKFEISGIAPGSNVATMPGFADLSYLNDQAPPGPGGWLPFVWAGADGNNGPAGGKIGSYSTDIETWTRDVNNQLGGDFGFGGGASYDPTTGTVTLDFGPHNIFFQGTDKSGQATPNADGTISVTQAAADGSTPWNIGANSGSDYWSMGSTFTGTYNSSTKQTTVVGQVLSGQFDYQKLADDVKARLLGFLTTLGAVMALMLTPVVALVGYRHINKAISAPTGFKPGAGIPGAAGGAAAFAGFGMAGVTGKDLPNATNSNMDGRLDFSEAEERAELDSDRAWQDMNEGNAMTSIADFMAGGGHGTAGFSGGGWADNDDADRTTGARDGDSISYHPREGDGDYHRD